MTEFSPAVTFRLLHKPAAEELQKHREDAWLKTGFAYTLSEMAHQGASAEKLAGARAFVSVFLNLWESDKGAAKLPQQRLESYERPIDEVIKEQKSEEAVKKK